MAAIILIFMILALVFLLIFFNQKEKYQPSFMHLNMNLSEFERFKRREVQIRYVYELSRR